jgi:hypothetical protein
VVVGERLGDAAQKSILTRRIVQVLRDLFSTISGARSGFTSTSRTGRNSPGNVRTDAANLSRRSHGKGPELGALVVAGVGFEPTTSGL